MTDFPEYNLENLGGASSFNFIPKMNVQSIPFYIANKLINPVVLKTGASWFKGLAMHKSLKFDETTKETDSGVIYEYTISGIYPGNNADLAAMFDEMKSQVFLLDVTDNNKNRRILGNLQNPVKFKFAYTSKDQPGSRPEYSFSFTWSSPKPAPFYNI